MTVPVPIVKEILECPEGCKCTELDNYNFCGSDTVESEICFVPGVAGVSTVDVEIDPANFHVELVCCNLIVVCGFITKDVSVCGSIFKTKDIFVQIKVPANICNPDYLSVDKWRVTGAEVCDGCYILTCPDKNGNYHKLKEKDIVSVQVDSIPPPPPPPPPEP